MSLPISPSEASYWQALAEHLAGLLPSSIVLDVVERHLAHVQNPATQERLRDRMRLLLGLDQEWYSQPRTQRRRSA